MIKYLYLFGIILSYTSFFVGWSHYLDNGFAAFNLGFMSLTPVISFTLTLIWLREQNKKEEDFLAKKLEKHDTI